MSYTHISYDDIITGPHSNVAQNLTKSWHAENKTTHITHDHKHEPMTKHKSNLYKRFSSAPISKYKIRNLNVTSVA